MKGIENKAVSFEGEMENPDENVRFAVSGLRLKTTDKIYRNLSAEIELTNNYEGWEVHLNIYSKKYQEKKEKEEEYKKLVTASYNDTRERYDSPKMAFNNQ